MFYIFNELSLTKIQLNSIEEAKKILEEFIKTSIIANEYGFDELRIHESIHNLYNLNLLENYRIDTWLNDKDVNNDIKDKFREIITSSPLIKENELDELNIYEWSEFSINFNNIDETVYGLGASHIFKTISFSLDCDSYWDNIKLTILHNSINNDCVERNEKIEVYNFSNQTNLQSHKARIDSEIADNISKSIEIWDEKNIHFPNLLFGTDVENQLKRTGLNKQFYQTYDVLKKLDDFSKNWTNGNFNLKDLKQITLLNVSGESATTMQKFSASRKFKMKDGKKEQFELHIKLPSLRIYFLPDDSNFQITVGYIGKHLRISSMD